jgi:hypothetical protein
VALLVGCCAITVFFAFQVPFRLLANGNHVSPGEFRGEISALPIRLAGQTGSDFRTPRSHRSGSDDKELASSSFADSGSRRGLRRERLVQRKQTRLNIEPAAFSRHN